VNESPIKGGVLLIKGRQRGTQEGKEIPEPTAIKWVGVGEKDATEG